MAKFIEAFNKTLGHEGGYVNDPTDPGGETKWGISKRAYPNVNIKNLTVEQAQKIYLKDYWRKCKLNGVDDQEVAEQIFDVAVNSGTKRAGLMIQEACNILGNNLVEDGIIGSLTVNAINKIRYSDVLVKVISYLRVKYYLDLIQRKPAMRKYIWGWLRRV